MLLTSLGIRKIYNGGAAALEVLKSVDLEMDGGNLVGIYGASGTGKSTLLHILGGLDTPTSGSVLFEGQNLVNMSEPEMSRFRNRSIGFVFQFYHLLPEFTAVENTMMPCLIAGLNKKKARQMAMKLLEEVGLSDRASHRPGELSGGEQQRVALARAAVMQPKLILADEPTGNLDRETGEKVFEYLLRLNREEHIAMIIVSHNQELLTELPRKLLLRDGILHEN